nr:phosphoribosylaminoimidazole carboxylase, chloroplastic isoform X1 [Tanacetum cinerariifolium]
MRRLYNKLWKKRENIRQDEEKERYYKEQRQRDFNNDSLNPKNFIMSEDKMDVDAINKTPTPNNLNVNTQESVVVHTASCVVKPAIAEGLVEDEMIDKVVVAEEVGNLLDTSALMYLMLSPSSHQVGFTSAFSSNRSSLLGFRTVQKLSSTSISSCSSSCPMINQQSARSISCRASIESDVSQRKEDVPAPHGLSDKIVGVLGGGQLGRMLCQAASQMAIKVNILDPLENCPASSISHYHMVGSFDDSATVEEFAKRCEILTVEIEHVDADTLEKLEKQGVDCQPKASTIRIIQDKYLQKVHFSGHGIPLPRFKQIEDLESAIKAGRDNSILCYPAVETVHRDNICHIVKAPANESWKIMKLATDVASRAVASLEGAGVFAVELFLTEDGEILLNEVAPRPHNSGHHTIESCYTSQYEQHLRAVAKMR